MQKAKRLFLKNKAISQPHKLNSARISLLVRGTGEMYWRLPNKDHDRESVALVFSEVEDNIECSSDHRGSVDVYRVKVHVLFPDGVVGNRSLQYTNECRMIEGLEGRQSRVRQLWGLCSARQRFAKGVSKCEHKYIV